MKRSLLLSILIHLALLSLFFLSSAGKQGKGNCEGPDCKEQPEQGEKNEGKGEEEKEIPGTRIDKKPLETMKVTPEVLKQIEKQEQQMKLEEEQKKEQAKAEEEAKADCSMWFGGIGITLRQFDNNTIETVHPGYPAERAGILAGDKIYSEGAIKGEIGTTITVTIERNGDTFKVTMTREKICVVSDEIPKPGPDSVGCEKPKIINETTESWGSDLDLRTLKRAEYVCRQRYEGCISRLFKRTVRDYAVLCLRDQVRDKYALRSFYER